jgi:N-methylhydantoinase B
MTNTLNTPIEVIEPRYPLRIEHYGLRKHSGGEGLHRGGEGLIRRFRFLAPTQVTLLTERRVNPPWGIAGGSAGCCGINWHNEKKLGAKVTLKANIGDLLSIETPGGGGWGKKPKQ